MMSDDQFTQLRDQMAGFQGQFTHLRDQMTTLQDQVGGLQDQVGSLQDQVGGLQGQIDGLQNRVGSLQGQVTDMQGQIDGLRDDMDQRFLRMTKHMNGRFDTVEKQLEDKAEKSKINLIYTQLDSFLKRTDTDETERAALGMQVNRHEGWLQQIAKTTGDVLAY